MKTLEEGDPGLCTGKGLRCYRQRQEFLPPFETPQCYLIVGKAPPGPGGVLSPCFGKLSWAWDTWQWVWGDPGTSSCVGQQPAPSWACVTGMWHSQEWGPGHPVPSQCSHSRAPQPSQSIHCFGQGPKRHPKLLPCPISGSPEGTWSRSVPAQPSKQGSLPHSTETRVSRQRKEKMQSGITCKLGTSLAPATLGKHRCHPALPVAAPLLPHSRAAPWGTSGEQGMLCTGCASWICCDTSSRSPVFIWLLYNFSPGQTPDQSTGSQKQSGREHDWGHWTVSDVIKQWGVPSLRSRASQTRVILGCLGICCQTHTSV